MKKNAKIWIFWAVTYVLCTVCAFVPNPQGGLYGAFLLLSLGFFIPPGWLVYRAVTQKDARLLKILRNLSFVSLGGTLGMILINFLAARAPEAWGTVLYWILILISAPMVCSQVWVVSLFMWACLLMTCLTFLKKK